jgi:hypothetical protein
VRGTSSVALSGTIPWIDAAAPRFQAPAPSPASQPAADARVCRAVDVTANFGGDNGAGGHSITYVQFRNVSQSACVLKGYPEVTASERGLPEVVATNGSFFQGPRDATANMPPGQQTNAGSTLTYIVVLTNPTDGPISLTPCPGYIQSARTSTPVKDLYALNCAPVAAIDAHKTVRFEMRMAIPGDTPTGSLTIFWSLIGPSRPRSSAVLIITTPPTPSRS